MGKKIIFAIVIIVTIVSLLIGYGGFRAPGKSKEKERFVVALNDKEEQVVDRLFESGFIRNKKVFNFILGLEDGHGKISPGGYLISKSQNAYQLAKTLIAGPYQKWVLVPPGKRKEQTALILQKALGWPEDMRRSFVLVAQEGYLYPDTYLINIDSSPQEVFQKFLNNFNEKFDVQLQHDLLAQNIRTDTSIKIASLIERESGGSEDKPIIAAVIWNRLNIGMKLEIDATVQYAIVSEELKANSEEKWINFDFWPKLGAGIVRTIDSLYNTYRIKTLPPGPICSPSIESIHAVAYPTSTDALYYLHSPDKQIHTAKTYKEHQKNIEKYLQN